MVGKLAPVLLLLGCASMSPSGSARASGPQEIGPVFQRVNGAVAVIYTVEQDVPAMRPGETPVSQAGLGSGVLISRDGKVLTAAHVVQTADEVEVAFLPDHRWKARVVASDPSADVALLQLSHPPPESIPVAPLGNSDAIQVGDRVFVVGAPLGATHTLTVGHVSARRTKPLLHPAMEPAEFFQTDAAINQGNSGGPMFDLDGNVVGIVSHIMSLTGGSEGLGFAVTSNLAQRILLERKSIWSGVGGVPLTGLLARAFNAPNGSMLVQRVARESPGSRLGIQGGELRATIAGEEILLGGDVVLQVQGLPILAARDEIRRRIQELRNEGMVRVRILRGGREQELSAPKGALFAPPAETGTSDPEGG